jgi:hypothetical protein
MQKICKVNGTTTMLTEKQYMQHLTIHNLLIVCFESGTTIIEPLKSVYQNRKQIVAITEKKISFIKPKEKTQ